MSASLRCDASVIMTTGTLVTTTTTTTTTTTDNNNNQIVSERAQIRTPLSIQHSIAALWLKSQGQIYFK